MAKKTAPKVDFDILDSVFTQDQSVYSRSFYFFGTFALVLVFFAFLTFFIVFLTEATEPPSDVLITDVTNNSITITWKTEQKTKGLVVYTPATTPRFLRPIALLSLPSNYRAFDLNKEKTQYHTVTLNRLSNNTAYLYRISTGLHTYKIDSEGKLLPAIKTGL